MEVYWQVLVTLVSFGRGDISPTGSCLGKYNLQSQEEGDRDREREKRETIDIRREEERRGMMSFLQPLSSIFFWRMIFDFETLAP